VPHSGGEARLGQAIWPAGIRTGPAGRGDPGRVRAELFDRDVPVQPLVAGPPHRRGRAATDPLQESVAASQQHIRSRILDRPAGRRPR
jgi:hypothetical protein